MWSEGLRFCGKSLCQPFGRLRPYEPEGCYIRFISDRMGSDGYYGYYSLQDCCDACGQIGRNPIKRLSAMRHLQNVQKRQRARFSKSESNARNSFTTSLAEREGFDYAISSKYKELLPLAHITLCLCGLQAHSYLWVQWQIVATVSTVLVFSAGVLGGAEGRQRDRFNDT